MKFIIKHEIRGRMRVHLLQNRMTFEQADTLLYYLSSQKLVTGVKVREKTQDATINFVGDREEVIRALKAFHYETAKVPEIYLKNSGRELQNEYWEKLVNKVVMRMGSKMFLPVSVRSVITAVKSVKYLWHGVRTIAKGKLEVPVLDATAIGVSIFRGDFETAGSTMFLLGIGEILEEWTHKKSVDDLARSMSLHVSRVWLMKDGQEILVPSDQIRTGDEIVVHMGNVIPFDGVVTAGDAMVNQASLTGESVPVQKNAQKYAYAGTVVEEGELTICVKEVNGGSKFEKIVTMIEESEKLKSNVEGKAEHLADRLVPYTLAGTGLTYLLTRNMTKTLAVLMVDFSCALKLAMPISVLSAIREASLYDITVKGGKFLEAIAQADTIVFDKTGTLTKAEPTVAKIETFCERSEEELLRIAACLEEHFPHSMAKAVVDAAKKRNIFHEEMHSKVEYIVAHGISTMKDEHCVIPDGMEEKFAVLPEEYSHLYLAIDGKLAAVICIHDPIRQEAFPVINSLKRAGISKVVMMTGDSERTARAVAAQIGVDEYYSEVLPEDKAGFVEREKAAGRKVIMIGDGINDSPALSAADVGIAISDGAEIAREIADVTIGADNLYEIVTLKAISNGLMKRIHKNYRSIILINAGLIALGVTGIIQPTTSALLHNTSTLVIGLKSMQNLID